jgi:hypothetical protein
MRYIAINNYIKNAPTCLNKGDMREKFREKFERGRSLTTSDSGSDRPV